MAQVENPLSTTFQQFFQSERAGSVLLTVFALLAFALANSPIGTNFVDFWQNVVGGLSLAYWVNDGLMAVFFLPVGLELKRELVSGELSNLNKALFPVLAAAGEDVSK